MESSSDQTDSFQATLAKLKNRPAPVSVATVATVLHDAGYPNCWVRDCLPLHTVQGLVVGEAFTMRFLPSRPDLLAAQIPSSHFCTRAAIEAAPAGSVLVVDTCGIDHVGIFGDVLCTRMAVRGLAGLVCSGSMRDTSGIKESGLPVWARGPSARPSYAALSFAGWGDAISCGGVAVVLGDLIMADADGAIVIPRDLFEPIVEKALQKEREDAWVLNQIKEGQGLPGLYPMNEETRSRFTADD